MAGDEDYGSARITLDLDESGAERDAAAIGAAIERALNRATRNIGRGIRENIQRSLRSAAITVQVEADLSRLEQNLRRQLGRLRNLTVPVSADLRAFQRSIRRGGAATLNIPVTPDVGTFTRDLNRSLRRIRAEIEVRGSTTNLVRQIQRELSRVRPSAITVPIEADVSQIQARLRSLDVPRIEATITLDVDRIESQLRELASRDITIPIHLGEPDGGGGGGGDIGGGLLDTLRGSLPDASSLGLGFGAEALGGIRAGLLAAGPWGAVAAGVLAYGALVGKALMTGIEGVIEQQKIAGTLRANLGLGAGEANDAGHIVGNLYSRGVVDSVEEGTAAVKAAIRSGLAAPDDLPGLEKLSTQISDVGALMEEDVGKVARAVGQMVKTGLVDNASEGLDLLTKSVQQGGNQAEDLLDTFTEYPTQFRQLGLSAEEAFGLIQQGLRGGARDSDVIADTLKEFSIEAAQGGKRVTDAFKAAHLDADRLTDAFAKGGPSARKALDEVFDKLQSIEDPLKRNQLAVGLFGTKAEDMAGALANLNLDTAAKEMDGFGNAATRAGDDLRDNLGTKLTRISREAKQAFQGLFTGDFSQFADVGDAIRDALPDLKETGRQMAESIQQGITQYGPKIFEAVFKIAEDIGERVDIWGPLLLKLVAGAAALPAVMGALILTAIGGALSGLGAAALPYVEAAWDAVVGFFTETVPGWGSDLADLLSSALTSAWEAATGALSSVGSSIGDFFVGVFESATSAVSTGITAVVDFFTQLPGKIVTALLALPGLLLDAFTSAVAYAVIGLLTVVAGLVFIFTELPGKIYNGLLSLGSLLISAFVAGFNAVTSTLSGWLDNTVEFFQALPGRAYNALAALGSFLLRAFTSGFNSVTSTLSGWLSSTISFFRALPGRILSALSALGSFLVRAFSTGINNARTNVTNGITTIVGFFRAAPGKIASALSALPGRLASAFTSAAGSAKRAVTSLISGVVSLFSGLGGKIVAAMGNVGAQIVSKVKSGLPSAVRKYLPFAKGGIVYGPTHALIGEAGPEVVIPLTKPKRAMDLAARSGLLGMLGMQQAQALAAADSGSAAAVSGGVGDLRKALSGIASLLDGIGADVVAGMVAGIRDNTGDLVDAATDLADSAIVAARDTLEIHSPSKVFAKIGTDVGRGFIAGLTGTSAQIKSTTEKLAKDIISAFSGKKTTLDDRLVRLVDAGNKKLTSLAAQRDALTQKIADAQKFATETTQKALDAFSLSNLTQGADTVTAKSLTAGLEDAVARVKTFGTQLNTLARRGLSKDLLTQIVGLGPDAGEQIAAALAGSTKDSLKRLNNLQSQLSKASTTLGRTSADVLYDAGKNAGAGFLAGLQGQRKNIEKLMLDIAKGMQASIRAALRIHSPSRVFMAIGDLTGLGLHIGLLRRLAGLQDDSEAAARALADGVRSQLSGLGSSLPNERVVIPLTRAQRARQGGSDGWSGRGAAAASNGPTMINNFEIREVGDAHATAHRVVNRLVLAAGAF